MSDLFNFTVTTESFRETLVETFEYDGDNDHAAYVKDQLSDSDIDKLFNKYFNEKNATEFIHEALYSAQVSAAEEIEQNS